MDVSSEKCNGSHLKSDGFCKNERHILKTLSYSPRTYSNCTNFVFWREGLRRLPYSQVPGSWRHETKQETESTTVHSSLNSPWTNDMMPITPKTRVFNRLSPLRIECWDEVDLVQPATWSTRRMWEYYGKCKGKWLKLECNYHFDEDTRDEARKQETMI